MAGKHVSCTPTGSGKSLVAVALELKALAEGKHAYYTCPIKASFGEVLRVGKELGARNVGMVTVTLRSTPICQGLICCTAEILSNLALREGAEPNRVRHHGRVPLLR